MKYIYHLIIFLIALLSVAAGIAKIVQTPQEVEFLQSFGFNSVLIIIFGSAQTLGGALLTNKKARLYGAVITLISFLFSSILIFASGDWEFGLISLLPVVLTVVIVKAAIHFEKTKGIDS